MGWLEANLVFFYAKNPQNRQKLSVIVKCPHRRVCLRLQCRSPMPPIKNRRQKLTCNEQFKIGWDDSTMPPKSLEQNFGVNDWRV